MVLSLAFGSVSPSYAGDTKPDNKPKTVVLQGKILDESTGEPLTGAEVRVSGTEIKTYSDLNGNFIFSNLNEGQYDILIKMVSYQQTTYYNLEASDLNSDLTLAVSPF